MISLYFTTRANEAERARSNKRKAEVLLLTAYGEPGEASVTEAEYAGVKRRRSGEQEEDERASGARAADQWAEHNDDEKEEEVAPAARKKHKKRRGKGRANGRTRTRAKKRGDYGDVSGTNY